VLVVAHAARTVIIVSIPAAYLLGLLRIEQLIVVAFLLGCFGLLFETAYHSYLPDLVPSNALAGANRKLSISDGAVRAAGPGLAGAVIQAIGAPVALAVQSLGFAICAIGTAVLPDPPRRRSNAQHPLRDLVEGLRAVRSDRVLRRLIIQEIGFVFAFDFTFVAILATCTDRLGLSAAQIGLTFSVGAVGGLVAAVGYPAAARVLGDGAVLRTGLISRAVGLAAMPLALLAPTSALVIVAASRAICSAGWAWWDIARLTTIQIRTDRRLLGRVSGTTLFTARTAELIGALAAGGVIPILGPEPVIIIGGTAAVITSLSYRPVHSAG
jgi:Na+/melibiose symporter-like transporter